MKRSVKVTIGVLVVIGLLLIGAPWIYINLIKDDAPISLSLDSIELVETTVPTTGVITDANGNWNISSESVVGYRVKEVLFGQSTEGVGRTQDIAGSLSIVDNSVAKATFTVQMGTLISDAEKRDAQFNSRIMDVDTYPTAVFTLTKPIVLPPNAVGGGVVSTTATGTLLLRGTTQPVTFNLEAQVKGDKFSVAGAIKIVFSEWGIPNPGFGGITTEQEGLLEFLLVFGR
jgi:polyisoprenoid-binding protein YceI